jgi:hypothetical protein
MKGATLQAQAIVIGQIVYATTQDVVLCNDLPNIERVLDPLQTVRPRRPRSATFGNCLRGVRLERGNQLIEESRHMIIEGGNIQRPGGG